MIYRIASRLVVVCAVALLCFVCAYQSVARSFPGEGNQGKTSSQTEVSTGERGALPHDEYNLLRTRALASARVILGAKLRNPAIAENGLDPAIVGALQQQRAYLAALHPLNPDSLLAEGANGFAGYGTGVSPTSEKTAIVTAPCQSSIIRSVNGRHEGAVFTPRIPDNTYRILGCSFGNARGRVQLEPRGSIAGKSIPPIVLRLDNSDTAWSDTEIDVHLDPHLSGISDAPVALVIYPAKGKRIALPGCFFVALRGEPQLLSAIPASWVKLHASTVRSRSIQQLEYVSPPVRGGDVPDDAAATSALVVRFDLEPFGWGSDTYDFSHLNPGWVVDSVQLQTYSVSCPGDVTYTHSLGRWDATWLPQGFTVAWQDDACGSSVPPFFTFALSFSQYAAKVWVIGPAGTQPLPHRILPRQ